MNPTPPTRRGAPRTVRELGLPGKVPVSLLASLTGHIAVKVINYLGDKVMKVFPI
jgi:hypothetical protein